jgi:hypothetical protein
MRARNAHGMAGTPSNNAHAIKTNVQNDEAQHDLGVAEHRTDDYLRDPDEWQAKFS